MTAGKPGGDTRVEAALELHQLGWNVVAAARGQKFPFGQWRRWQTERVSERFIRATFAGGSEPNLFLITGSVSRICVLDCDNEAAIVYWRERLGDVLDRTASVKTGNGRHYYFRLAEGQKERGRSSGNGEAKWDIRAEGGGVIAPPSVHPSGAVYTWEDGKGPEAIQDAPDALWAAGANKGDEEGEDGARSLLSHLLSHPPDEGGRNVWLAKVAGHYALHVPYEDAYEAMVRQAADGIVPPLPEEEIAKLIKSIWTAELIKKGKLAPDVDEDHAAEEEWRANLVTAREDNGWLMSGKTHISCQTRERDQSGWKISAAPWMDADIRVRGIIGSGADRAYEVEVARQRDGAHFEDILDSAVVTDQRALAAWLSGYGVSIAPPDNIHPTRIPTGARLLRYLEAQQAEAVESVDYLGWHDVSGVFITHDGVVNAEGWREFNGVRPRPDLREWAPYRYGRGDRNRAKDVLKEVLTFHDETVAAVFGAWWAAAFLKPQIHQVSSQFPFMALEATSESGKTTGFFSLMLQLSGNTNGQSLPTRAALRDYLSAHRNGIVWMDDLDSLEHFGELLRQVTVEGSLVKKGEGNHRQVVAQLRAALVISGENLGLHDQKALLDRAVLLEVPSPVGRKSTKGDRPQWDDILTLKSAYPDLAEFAGTMVQLALEQEDAVREIKKLRIGAGRFADKNAVLRVGARILRRITGQDEWVDRVDAWTAGIKDHGAENALTLKLLPAALSRCDWPTVPSGPVASLRQVATPAFVEGKEGEMRTIWFSPKLLAEWWSREPGVARMGARVESEEALMQQARALGLGGSKDERRQFRLQPGRGKHFYWRMQGALADLVIERAEGGDWQ